MTAMLFAMSGSTTIVPLRDEALRSSPAGDTDGAHSKSGEDHVEAEAELRTEDAADTPTKVAIDGLQTSVAEAAMSAPRAIDIRDKKQSTSHRTQLPTDEFGAFTFLKWTPTY